MDRQAETDDGKFSPYLKTGFYYLQAEDTFQATFYLNELELFEQI